MYVKYNINPKNKKTSDCAIRAVAVATGLGWDKAYSGLSEAGFLLKTAMNDTEAVDYFLRSIGFKKGKIQIIKGCKRITMTEFAEQHPDWYCVVRLANHLSCCSMGNYVDIWDCGESCVYTYWYRERQ